MSTTPTILFGIETEYGIARDGVEDLDVVAESIALVRSAMEPGVRMRWEHEAENPHHDDRGWGVPAGLFASSAPVVPQAPPPLP